jgi:catechol 2,3-dioxygenase-like lactoylglutathione lyase family enzyme
MAIQPATPGIHHISLRCQDLDRTKHFYQVTIGLPILYESPDLVAFGVGNVLIGFRKANSPRGQDAKFDPHEVGMDHLAIACETEEELQRVAKRLTDAGVENTGIKVDNLFQKNYVAFKDPDRIQWEFFMV